MSEFDYDALVVGAGMAGMAAGIRLCLAGKSVLLVERHEAPGGLNSFYRLGGRNFDVGLHAMTNYVGPGTRKAPLTKLFRQLRIDRGAFELSKQNGSEVRFPGCVMAFSNDFDLLQSEVERLFPSEIDGFLRMVKDLDSLDSLSLDRERTSARQWLDGYLRDPLLVDMLLCPLCYYGSSIEDDLELSQFAILFQAIFKEGFARPFEGVRKVIRVLLKQYKSLGGERRMRCGVSRIRSRKGLADEVELDDGSVVRARKIFSTIGRVETEHLIDGVDPSSGGDQVGKLSFVESMLLFDGQPRDYGWEKTIVFFSTLRKFRYRRPDGLVDPCSGVICFPNNYQYPEGKRLPEGILRVTAIANYQKWGELGADDYRRMKEEWFDRLIGQAMKEVLPPPSNSLPREKARDMFTPLTIERFTGHLGGAVYGSREKVPTGKTSLENLFLCGTDQGFLGIVGAMLSGISVANKYGVAE